MNGRKRNGIQAQAEEIVEEKRQAAQVEHCVICGNDSDMFGQPGKKLHGKYVCPNCVRLI